MNSMEPSMNTADGRFLVENGTVDIRGNIADKRVTGGWKASPFIIMNEVAERLSFFTIAVSMIAYLVREMHQSLPMAASHVSDFIGAAYFLTIFGAFIADAYLGRFKTIMVFSCVYAVGMVLLTLSASVDTLRPPKCIAKPCPEATQNQSIFLFVALALISVGTGGIKPCISSFGADQFDEGDKKEVTGKSAFFNWFFFGINMGAVIALTLMVYIGQEKGYAWGFGVPMFVIMSSVFILAAGMPFYRYQKPMGSAFTRFAQVIVASVKNHIHIRVVGARGEYHLYEVETKESDIFGARKLSHTPQYSFLDKAAVVTDLKAATNNRWNLCTVTQVEEFKSFIRILPIWASTIAVALSYAQLSTFFISQAIIMDRKLTSSYVIPPGSVPIFACLNGVILVPIYEYIIIPFLRRKTGHPRGLTSLQRIGVGLFVAILSLVLAALVEKKRRQSPDPSSMSVLWLFPQYFLVGSAEVFTYVGQLEFFYDQATDGTRSINTAMFLSETGLGSWLSSAIVKIVVSYSGGETQGWLRHDLNESRLDYFYWILAVINGVNFVVYLWVAKRYKGRDAFVGSVRPLVHFDDQNDRVDEKSLRNDVG